MGRLFPVHDGGALVAPHGQRQGVSDGVHERRHPCASALDGIEPAQAGQAQLEGGRAQVVAGAVTVLRDQVQALEADQVTVRLGRAHARGGGQIA